MERGLTIATDLQTAASVQPRAGAGDRNATFAWLEAILILMVVDCHAGSALGFLSGVFPYDSFFMPAFVAVSGYFWRYQPLGGLLRKKLRTQLAPYLAWSGAGILVSHLVNKALGLHWLDFIKHEPLSKVLWTTFAMKPPTSANGAAWFLIMLFWLQVVYALLQAGLIRDRRRGNYAALVVLLALACVSVQLCVLGYQEDDHLCFFLRQTFYLVFFHTGHMLRSYWEEPLRRIAPTRVIGICLAANVALIACFDKQVTFPSTSYMVTFHVWWLPFVTSVTGFLFWYEVSSFLARSVGEIPAVALLSRNSSTIMQVHLFGECLPLLTSILLARWGLVAPLPAKVLKKIQATAWSRTAVPHVLLFACGLGLSLMVILALGAVRRRVGGRGRRLGRHGQLAD